MATFNPYNRAVKESINVDTKDRHSPQKVILCNRENKFFGEFIGKMRTSNLELSGVVNSENAIIRDGIISGGIIVDSKLSNIAIDGLSNLLSTLGGELSDLGDHLSSIDSQISGLSDYFTLINSQISDFSDSLSSIDSQISGLSDCVSSISSQLSGLSCNLSDVSDKIDKKIFIINPDCGLSDYSDLSVVKLGLDEYARLLIRKNLNHKTLYIVSSDYVNSYGQRVSNVGTASSEMDAVNLGTLKTMSSEIEADVNRKFKFLSGELSNSISCISSQISTISSDLSSLTLSVENISSCVQSLSDDVYNTISVKVDNKIYILNGHEGIEGFEDLSVIRLTQDEYEQLVYNEKTNPKTIYIVDYEILNAYGRRIINLGDSNGPMDAVNLRTVQDVSVGIDSKFDERVSELSGSLSVSLSGLSSCISAISDDVYNTISVNVDNKIYINNYEQQVDGYNDLSVVKISQNEYEQLVYDRQTNPKTIYVVEYGDIDAYGQNVKNVADAVEQTDAVNLGQMLKITNDSSRKVTKYYQDLGLSSMTEQQKNVFWNSVSINELRDILSSLFEIFVIK